MAELIAGAGLADYYRYRQQPGNKPDIHASDRWQSYAQPAIAAAFVTERGDENTATLLIGGLRCAACVWLIERHLRELPGVLSIHVNAATERAQVRWRKDALTLADILRRIADLGYQPQPLDRQHASDAAQQQTQREQRMMLKRLGVAALGMMQVMMYVLPLYVRDRVHMGDDVAQSLAFIGLLITTPVLLYSGWPFLHSAARAIRHRHINMDVPVALALLLAFVASVINLWRHQGQTYFDSVTMFIFLLTLGRYVEMRVRHRTGSITDALSRMQPDIAHRLCSVIDPYSTDDRQQEEWLDVAAAQLQIGDELLVRSGETIPADGIALNDHSTVNESLLTGESLPIAKHTGDAVMAGTINVSSPMRMRVTALGNGTLLSGLVRMMEQAQFDKPRLALQADRVARVFLHVVLWLCVLVGAAWYAVNPARAFDAVLAVLVVTCPCALSLAMPTVIAACISAMGRCGVLVTRADAIECLAQIDAVWFDKTGTLTKGQMQLKDMSVASGMTRERALSIAAALEAGAQHPIAEVLRHHAVQYAAPSLTATDLQVLPGRGVQGKIAGGTYRLGTREFVTGTRGANDATSDAAVVLGRDDQELAAFHFSDALRTDAAASVNELRQQGVQVALYSGDAEVTVAGIADQLDIRDRHARQSPADKLCALKASAQRIAMVGDGVNDAPVLAAAHVSIAMGQGTALAQASADMLLMNSTLHSLPMALRLARKSRHIMRQNLWWAVSYNLVAVPLAAVGFITPWLAALGMSLSSVLVTLNAARVMRVSAEDKMPPVQQGNLALKAAQLGSLQVTLP